MSKPAPLAALELIASGRVLIEVTRDGDVAIDRFDGRVVRDDEHPGEKMRLAGGWPLYKAGMIDDFGLVTDAGRAALAEHRRGK
ncbi:MAG: hypothetical protein K0R27_157 [Xanthobacteraceae bacterium]|jgi:hypothetical protein|nr:hypothetical protein [Xanthobacteraceae bacterium]